MYGSYNVGGRIETEYLARGGPGVLGNPTQGEWDASRGGKFQVFQNNASIYWHPLVNNGYATTVGGAIRTAWGDYGWEDGPLRYPTTSEISLSKNNGRLNNFEGGSIYWSPNTGAYAVWGAIKDQWQAQGWENGALGYPTSDEYPIAGGLQQNFEGGYLSFNVGPEPDGDPNSLRPMYGADDPFNKFANRYIENGDGAPRSCSEKDAQGVVVCFSIGKATDDESAPPGFEIDPTVTRQDEQSEGAEITPTEESAPTSSTTPPSSEISPTTSPAPTSPSMGTTTSLPCPTPETSATTTTPSTTTSLTPTPEDSCAPGDRPSDSKATTTSTSSPTPTTQTPQNRPFPASQQTPPARQQTPSWIEPPDPPRDLLWEKAFFTGAEPKFGGPTGNWCVGKELNNWTGKRFYGCQVSRYEMIYYQAERFGGLKVIGADKGFIYRDVITNAETTTVNARAKFLRKLVTGVAGPGVAEVTATDRGSTNRTGQVTPSTKQSVPLASNPIVSWILQMNVPTGVNHIESDRVYGNTKLSDSRYKVPLSDNEFWFPEARCDGMGYFSGTGCVLKPVNNKKNLPVLDLTTSDMWSPQLYDHVLNAQNSLLPGNPVGINSSVGTMYPLQRIIYNSKQARDNRAAACRTSRVGYHRPAGGYECDEYPFASTAQGGNSAPTLGRTFSWCNITRFPTGVYNRNGFSACFIPGDQNREGGNMLPKFNKSNRIMYQHDDPTDGYFVQAYHA